MKALLIVIDALASRVVRPAMDDGRLPNLQLLAAAGQVRWDSTAIFPSITPAATAALVTGGYPSDTGIAGAYYYDRVEDQVHYYGDDIWTIMSRGFANYVEDFLKQLNDRCLQAPTIYQLVERAGGTSAALNYLWFHGDHSHQARVPWLLRRWNNVKKEYTVQGPKILSLGDFVSDGPARLHLRGPGGFFNRYGFSDFTTSRQLLELAKARAFPEFTVAYFPENDFESHKRGPARALRTVERVDRMLGKLFGAYGGVDRLLADLAVLVTGDHAQSDLIASRGTLDVPLRDVLQDYQLVDAGTKWSDGDELMVCPNMRAAQIYLRPGYWLQRRDIVAALLKEERVDQVMWRESEGDGTSFWVSTADRGTLEFRNCDPHEAIGFDDYGGAWRWEGNMSTVDASLCADNRIVYRSYPNALERIANAFDRRNTGDLWLTCRTGHEFRLETSKIHYRGSHGSLHADDSLSPLIIAGSDRFPHFDKPPRAVDVTPLCCLALDLESTHVVGAAHQNDALPT
jgi:hypothetical protein